MQGTNTDIETAPNPELLYSSSSLTKRERFYAVLLFGLGIVIYFTVNIQRIVIPGQIFNELQSELGISVVSVANLGAVFMYVYAFIQLLVGLLVDKYGGMRVLTIGSLLLCAGALLFPFSHSLSMLYLSRILTALGCGAAFLSLVKEADRLYSHNFTSAVGLIVFLGYLGGVTATYPFNFSTKLIGWRTSLLIIALLSSITLLAIIVLWNRTNHPEISKCKISPRPYIAGFSNLYNLRMLFSYAANFAIYSVILTIIGKKFLEDICGLSSAVSSFTCTLMVIFSAILNQVSGSLSTYMGNKRRPFFLWLNLFPMIGLVMAIIGIIVKRNISPGWGMFFICSFVTISLTAGFSSITSAISRETNPPGSTGIAVGITNFAAYIMLAVLGSLTGLVLNCFNSYANIVDGKIIYPATAYLSLFIIFLLISINSFRIAFRFPETNGLNIYAGKKRKISIAKIFSITVNE